MGQDYVRSLICVNAVRNGFCRRMYNSDPTDHKVKDLDTTLRSDLIGVGIAIGIENYESRPFGLRPIQLLSIPIPIAIPTPKYFLISHHRAGHLVPASGRSYRILRASAPLREKAAAYRTVLAASSQPQQRAMRAAEQS